MESRTRTNGAVAVQEERARNFIGYAWLPIPQLVFDSPKHRPESGKKIQRLLRVFRLEGCDRHTEEHCINAVLNTNAIDANTLRQIQQSTRLDQARRADVGTLQIHCLHGLHRVRAAQKFLGRNDQWWPCRLFSADLSQTVATQLIEAYGNEQSYSDGEILLKILQYKQGADVANEKRWWARLSPTKQKDLKQLLRQSRFRDEFFKLSAYPGLFASIKLGTHRVATLKCNEEILCYLGTIVRVWGQITAQLPTDFVDIPTVQSLALRSPGIFRSDMEYVEKLVQNGDCLPKASVFQRRLLLRNLSTVKCMVPSLATFFEDLKFIEPCCTAMKKLLGENSMGSIEAGFYSSYFRPDSLPIEVGEQRLLTFSDYPTRSYELDQRLSYIQLWLYCLRHASELVGFTPRMESGKAKPVAKEESPAAWIGLGSLAYSLGFHTDLATEYHQKDVHLELARKFVRQSYPDTTATEDAASSIAATLKSIASNEARSEFPALDSDESLAPERRCGRPFELDYVADRHALFLHNLLQPLPSELDRRSPTPFFVKRNVLNAFFALENHAEDYSSFLNTPSTDRGHPAAPTILDMHACVDCARNEEVANELRQELTDLKINYSQLQNEFDTTTRERDDATRSKLQLESMLEQRTVERDSTSTALEEARSAWLDEKHHASKELKQAQAEADEQRRRGAESLTSTTTQRMRISQLESEKQELQKASQQEQRRLEDLNTTLNQQNATLTQQNATLTQQNATLTQQNATLTQQNAKLQESEKTLSASESDLRPTIEDQKQQLLELGRSVWALEGLHDKVSRENESLQKELTDCENEGRDLREQLKSAQEELDSRVQILEAQQRESKEQANFFNIPAVKDLLDTLPKDQQRGAMLDSQRFCILPHSESYDASTHMKDNALSIVERSRLFATFCKIVLVDFEPDEKGFQSYMITFANEDDNFRALEAFFRNFEAQLGTDIRQGDEMVLRTYSLDRRVYPKIISDKSFTILKNVSRNGTLPMVYCTKKVWDRLEQQLTSLHFSGQPEASIRMVPGSPSKRRRVEGKTADQERDEDQPATTTGSP